MDDQEGSQPKEQDITQIEIETRDTRQMLPADFEELRAFALNERELLRVYRSQVNRAEHRDEFIERTKAVLNHLQHVTMLTDDIREQSSDYSFINYAYQISKQTSERTLIGFGLMRFTPAGVPEEFYFGIAWEAQGKGIGLQLLDANHQVLRDNHVFDYETRTWERSRNVYHKASIFQKDTPEAAGKEEWYTVDAEDPSDPEKKVDPDKIYVHLKGANYG